MACARKGIPWLQTRSGAQLLAGLLPAAPALASNPGWLTESGRQALLPKVTQAGTLAEEEVRGAAPVQQGPAAHAGRAAHEGQHPVWLAGVQLVLRPEAQRAAVACAETGSSSRGAVRALGLRIQSRPGLSLSRLAQATAPVWLEAGVRGLGPCVLAARNRARIWGESASTCASTCR